MQFGINSQGMVLCENTFELNWPGQLPFDKLPNCENAEK
jgi:hypothetical protein